MHLEKINIYPDRFPTTEHYPFSLQLFQQTDLIRLESPITFLAGENGSGKSTLLRAIANKCGIRIWSGIERTRVNYNPYEKQLYSSISVEWMNGRVPGSFFSSQIFQNFAQILDEWASTDPGLLEYFGGKSLMDQSHGQSLMSFFKTRYKIKGLYLLDEPETALSPKSLLSLVNILNDMAGAGHAQFIIATHSPILLACPEAVILSFDDIPVKRVDYENTEYYRIYRDFMEDRNKFFAPE